MASQVIAGRYHIEGKIGQGGAAVVYKATDARLDRLVALKLLRDTYSEDTTFIRRFEQEARAAAKLGHPNIVEIYDYDQTDGQYYIAMQYLPQNLHAYLQAHAPLSEAQSRNLISQILEGLSAAHDAGLVHRDMKPQNVLMTARGQLKVTDFGIAKAMRETRLTATGLVFGTPHYMAPEQVEGKEVTPRADLYAVGVMLYEMLSGKLPFEGDTPMNVMFAHLHREPPPLTGLVPSLSPGMAEVVDRALVKDPDGRHQTADEMLQALGAIAGAGAPGVTPLPVADTPPADMDPAQTRTHQTPAPEAGRQEAVVSSETRAPAPVARDERPTVHGDTTPPPRGPVIEPGTGAGGRRGGGGRPRWSVWVGALLLLLLLGGGGALLLLGQNRDEGKPVGGGDLRTATSVNATTVAVANTPSKKPTKRTGTDTQPQATNTLAPRPKAPTSKPANRPTLPPGKTLTPIPPIATDIVQAPATPRPTQVTPSGRAGAECPGQKGGAAVVGIQQEPDILDPYITGMTFAVWIIHALDVPMVRATNVKDQFEPMLLTEVPTLDNGGVMGDGLIYRLNFREGLTWSDGQPLTGKDLVFTWKTIMNPAYGAGSQLGWDKIQDIKLSNNNLTATISLTEVYAPFFASIIAGSGATTSGFLLPEHKFAGKQPAQYAKSDYAAQGTAGHVGSGPFKLDSWKKGESLSMSRNDNYVGQKACLDNLTFQVVESVDAQTSALQTGGIDLALNYYASDIPTLEGLQGQGVKILANPAYLVERYVLNLNDPNDLSKPHPVLSDVRVRKAIAYAINRPAIVEKLLHGKAKVAVTEWDNSPWFNQNLKPYPYDPEGAKKLLDQAGWTPGGDGIRQKGGVRLSFTHATTAGNVIRETIQRAAINDLRNVGIEMNIQNVDASKLFATFSEGGVLSRRQFDIGGYTTGIGLDPDFSFYYHSNSIPSQASSSGSNYGGYRNAEVDSLWAQQETEVDPARRKELYDRIQQLMYDDVAVIYMYDRLQIDAAGPYLRTPPADFTGYIWWNPESISLDQ